MHKSYFKYFKENISNLNTLRISPDFIEADIENTEEKQLLLVDVLKSSLPAEGTPEYYKHVCGYTDALIVEAMRAKEAAAEGQGDQGGKEASQASGTQGSENSLNETQQPFHFKEVNIKAAPIDNENQENPEPVQALAYRIIEDLPQEYDKRGREKIVTVGGFVELGSKPNKQSKIKKKNKKLMANLFGAFPVLREKPATHRIVGYIKLADSDTYIALIKRKPLIILWWKWGAGAGVLGLVIMLLMFKGPKVAQPITDIFDGLVPKGEGEIYIPEQELPEAQNLRIIMNSSVTLIDGSMNVLIENNKESNELSMGAEVFLLNKLDEQGNIVESMNNKKIAQTPIIHPGENLEYLPIAEDVNLEPGYYDARVMFTAYEMVEEGALPIGQIAGRISLLVN